MNQVRAGVWTSMTGFTQLEIVAGSLYSDGRGFSLNLGLVTSFSAPYSMR